MVAHMLFFGCDVLLLRFSCDLLMVSLVCFWCACASSYALMICVWFAHDFFIVVSLFCVSPMTCIL